MRRYVIQQGDYLAKLAHVMGFDAEAVWNHEHNRELRARRPNHDILEPGEVLHIPAAERPADPLVRPRAQNRYRVRVPKVPIRLALRDEADQPLANQAYEVQGLGRPLQGTTDHGGIAAFEVPAHLREVTLVLVESRQEYQLLIGQMDPIDQPSGVRKRLQHLGFLARSDAAIDDERLRDAVWSFQVAHAITPTGTIDEATRDALERAHGC